MSVVHNLPTIVLDATLEDLYRRASPKNAHKRIAQVMYPVNSAIQLTPNIPRNVKYLYQDSAFNESRGEDGAFELSEKARRELAISYVALAPQRDAFLSGGGTVIMFDLGANSVQQSHNKNEATKTVSVLPDRQRPRLIFCPGPSDIPVRELDIDLMCYKLAPDGLEDYDLLIPLETIWYINAKGSLAKSGLPVPRCDIVEIEGSSCHVRLCCETCRGRSDSLIIPTTCTGRRGKWVSDQSFKIYQEVLMRPLPFVFKNQQAYGGAGTYLIHNETDREKLLRDLRGGVLRRMLSYVTESNKHLQPAAIVLSDLIDNPTATWGLSFFVTEDDEPIFLAVTELMLLEGRFYVGSMIQYDRQDELKRKFATLVKDMSTWLRMYDYIGPVGVDALETADPAECSQMHNSSINESDQHSNFYVLDINARTSGQLCLPLLRTHFTSRGLQCAATFFMRILKRREEFIEAFEDQFRTGRICILSWYDDIESDVSFGNVVIGAEDINKLGDDMKQVRDMSQELKF